MQLNIYTRCYIIMQICRSVGRINIDTAATISSISNSAIGGHIAVIINIGVCPKYQITTRGVGCYNSTAEDNIAVGFNRQCAFARERGSVVNTIADNHILTGIKRHKISRPGVVIQ